MRWKLYYDDLTTFSSEDGIWEAAPTDGVLFLNRWDADGTIETISHDFYFNHDGVMQGTEHLGPLLRKLGFIKFGRWANTERLEAVRTMANKDALWQQKLGT